jgi:hypothetical protein
MFRAGETTLLRTCFDGLLHFCHELFWIEKQIGALVQLYKQAAQVGVVEQSIGPPPGELRISSRIRGVRTGPGPISSYFIGDYSWTFLCADGSFGMVRILAISGRLDYSVKVGNVAFSAKANLAERRSAG